MKKMVFTLAMTSLLFAAIAQRADAGDNILWTPDGEPVSTAASHQYYPHLVSDGSGGVIIAWEDSRSGGYDIYAQRMDADGNALWTVDGVPICTAANSQYKPRLTPDGLGGAIIVWYDYRNGNYDIYAQKINSSGLIKWGVDGVPISTAAYTQHYPRIVSDGSGGAIIAWYDYRSNSNWDIYARRVNAIGTPLWTMDGVAICTAAGSQYSPKIVSDGSGGAIITWHDYRGADIDIYAQRVDSVGSTLWLADGEAICTAANSQSSPQLAADGSGGAIIAWEDYRSGGSWDIYAQRVSAYGDTLWLLDGEAICTAAGTQDDCYLASDGIGGTIIAWRQYQAGSNYDIFAQRIDTYGDPVWPLNGVPICAAPGGQYDPRIVSDGSEGGIITWHDTRAGLYDIYAQWIDRDGQTVWLADGQAICTAAGNQANPELIGDGHGGAIIAWADQRGGTNDVYAQRLGGPAPSIVSVSDVPGDQGREVALIWDQSYLDDPWYKTITEYSIWRKYPYGSKVESMGQIWDGTLPKDFDQRIYRLVERKDESGDVHKEAWEYIGTVDAHYLSSYAYRAPTLEDSSAGGPVYFSFFVSAHTADPFIFWDSDPDSGYSVDDINPAKTQMTVVASGSAKGSVNTVWLAWNQVTTGVDGSPEKGPIQYRVYYAENPGFTPGPGNLLTTISDTDYSHNDARIGNPAANLFYIVTAVDGSGNESAISNRVGEFDSRLSNGVK